MAAVFSVIKWLGKEMRTPDMCSKVPIPIEPDAVYDVDLSHEVAAVDHGGGHHCEDLHTAATVKHKYLSDC